MMAASSGDPDPFDLSSTSSGGGSAAAQAYREQLGEAPALGNLPASVGEAAAGAGQARDARVAERKKVSGRVRVSLNGHPLAMGKMVDISVSGACILVDDMMPPKKIFTLDMDIFHEGKRFVLNVQALSVYSVLASGGKGVKVGFQFGPRTPAATKTLEELLHHH